jgi:hypothetical protein
MAIPGGSHPPFWHVPPPSAANGSDIVQAVLPDDGTDAGAGLGVGVGAGAVPPPGIGMPGGSHPPL